MIILEVWFTYRTLERELPNIIKFSRGERERGREGGRERERERERMYVLYNKQCVQKRKKKQYPTKRNEIL